LITHQLVAVAAQVALANVITPKDEDVGLAVRHGCSWRRVPTAC
jgi:hypothetical protein